MCGVAVGCAFWDVYACVLIGYRVDMSYVTSCRPIRDFGNVDGNAFQQIHVSKIGAN